MLDLGADFPILGRVAILHHDYPKQLEKDANWMPCRTPVTRRHLADEGLSDAFIDYMSSWKGFIAD